MGFLQSIYNISPEWIQNLGISSYGIIWRFRRFGGVFKKELSAFESRGTYTCEEWKIYQTQQLRNLLANAYENVPYYQTSFRKSGFTLGDIKSFELKDLPRLPFLEKDLIRKSPQEFISKKIPFGKLHPYLTSGTTGTPLAIYFTNEMHQKWSAAYEARCRKWAGVNYGMKRAMIGGRLVVSKAHSRPPFWRYNFIEKQLYMSAFHISPKNTSDYVQALNQFQPDYLVGYASAHYFLARMITDKKLKVHRPKAVLTSSEKLTSEMRRTLESAYQCPVFDAYSGVEACCLISECEHHRMHISPDVGLVELVDEKGQAVASGETGEIVATGFLNEAQPLIRFRTGDYASESNEKCACGREMPIVSDLVGRLEDSVISKDGREMVRFHGVFIGIPKIKEGQVIQETLSNFSLKLVADSKLNEQEETLVYNRFKERLGEIQLRFKYVDQIERTERGKFRAVISKVKANPLSL